VQLRWVELTGIGKLAQYHEEQRRCGHLSLATSSHAATPLRELRPQRRLGPMSLPLFHTGGRDLAIVHGQSPLSETFQPAMVRMPARCFAAAVGRNFP